MGSRGLCANLKSKNEEHAAGATFYDTVYAFIDFVCYSINTGHLKHVFLGEKKKHSRESELFT